jgi:hypothetical protein
MRGNMVVATRKTKSTGITLRRDNSATYTILFVTSQKRC